jgi:UDP-glucose 4-epimerase
MGDEKLPEAQERTTENPVFQKSATGRIKRIIVFQPRSDGGVLRDYRHVIDRNYISK